MVSPSEFGETRPGINVQPPAAADPFSTRLCSRSNSAAAFSGCGLVTPLGNVCYWGGFYSHLCLASSRCSPPAPA